MSEAAREIPREEAAETQPLPQAVPEISMRWHGFLVKFYLWLTAVYHLFQAAYIILGNIYIEAAAREAIYAAMPAMRALDYSFAGLLAAGAVLQLVARARLARRKKAGIGILKGAYILLTLSFIVYLAARLLISGMPPVNLPLLGQAISCAALLWINHSYYSKRRSAFNP